MEISFYTLAMIIVIALVFDFINGFHDAANSIATIVSTRVLKPQWAVVWAAFFNFIAFLIFDTHVAKTIGTGIIDPQIIDPYLVLAALLGAIFWNLFTWYIGMPSSSSHALLGGFVGGLFAVPSLRISGGLRPAGGFFFTLRDCPWSLPHLENFGSLKNRLEFPKTPIVLPDN